MKDGFCNSCMNQNEYLAKFCSFCGSELQEVVQNIQKPIESKFIGTFRSRWSVAWIVIGVLMLVAIYELVSYLFGELGQFGDLLLGSIGGYGLMLIWILWIRRRNGLSLNVLFGKLSSVKMIGVHYLALMVIVGMGFSVSCTYMSIYLIIQLFGEISLIEALFGGGDLWPQNFSSIQAYLHVVLVIILLVVIAPIFEEIVFRGVFMTRWVVKWGYKRGIIFSSLLFGILHPGIIGPTVMGIILCCLYNRTKSLWVSVSFHVINNLIVVLLLLITGPGIMETDEFNSGSTMLPILGLFIVTGSIISFILYKLRPFKSDIIPYEHNLPILNVNNE